MTAQILEGKALANIREQAICTRVQERLAQGLARPGLAVIIMGNDPASHVYVRNKRMACERVGFHSHQIDLSGSTSQAELLDIIQSLNQNPEVHGILVQLPLPAHIDTHQVLDSILPHKDVDGFHPVNLGLLAQKRPHLRPCTPKGIMALLEHTRVDLKGLHAVIIGASNIVGRPMALELLLQQCTVSITHRATRDLSEITRQGDILVVAAGHPHLIQSSFVKPGAIVIDVGINRLPNGTLAGDVDFETVKTLASWITPVPGGVGPMTVVSLLENTFMAAANNSALL